MKPSQSAIVKIRGLDYHCRIWGNPRAPIVVLLHGFQDVSASWQFTVDALQGDWFVVAPDWRGYGLTQWSGADSYWFPDYLGDLDALLDELSPDAPVNLVGHSMGGNVGGLYAGVRPERVRRFVNIEGFGIGGRRQEPAPRRLARWLDELKDEAEQRAYDSFDEFAARMRAENPRLTEERARFLAEHWGREDEESGIVRRADPAHKRSNPTPTGTDDLLACWRETTAPVLWIEGAQSGLIARIARSPEEYEARKAAIQDLAIERIEGAGHNVHHDQPEELAAAIERFLLA
ncbi:MAG: alpha/beta fold hydrolase [Betaproteobacteria bacterium]|nr:alpha/beta fold hydrolase [Betaproteobacteria bacterium]